MIAAGENPGQTRKYKSRGMRCVDANVRAKCPLLGLERMNPALATTSQRSFVTSPVSRE